MNRLRHGWQSARGWRWPGVLSRVLAAVAGGYALGALVAVPSWAGRGA